LEKILVSGKTIIENAVDDLQSFFTSDEKFKVNVIYDAKNISCKGIGDKSRICFSSDLCEFPIQSIDDLHFVLFIVGHELAHYMHRHNEHDDRCSKESRSIEDWADFYGSKLVMVIITFGEKSKQIYRSFQGNNHSGERINSMGRALGKLAGTYFDISNKKYSNRLSRVGFCASGINSVIEKCIGNIDVNRSMSVMQRIYSDESLKNIMLLESGSFLREKENISVVHNIHKNIQSGNFEITEGLKEEYKIYIGTDYSTSEADRKLYIDTVKKIAADQGLSIDNLNA